MPDSWKRIVSLVCLQGAPLKKSPQTVASLSPSHIQQVSSWKNREIFFKWSLETI